MSALDMTPVSGGIRLAARCPSTENAGSWNGILLFAFLVCVLAPPGLVRAGGGPDSASFVAAVRTLEQEYGGNLGVMAKNLTTGEVLSYNAAERFATASVIKFPVMVAAFNEIRKGNLAADTRVTLTTADKKPGSGILQHLDEGASLTLRDVIRLMIVLSDNSATNMVLDQFADEHAAKLATVNDLMASLGLTGTRLLNRVFAFETKQNTGEAIRFGLGVSTPADMVMLLEMLYRRTLVDSASSVAMEEILRGQFYEDMMPRFLPAGECRYLAVAHKTGFVMESKGDVGIVFSDRGDLAMAIFVDKHGDHSEGMNNRAFVLAGKVAREAFDRLADPAPAGQPRMADVDWNVTPGGRWAIYRTSAAPFPHPDRRNGYTRSDGTTYPYFPHYADSSVLVFVPAHLKEQEDGVNLIVHFHGHMNDNLGVLERYGMAQTIVAGRINAILVLAQGPFRARDSFGGKMEDPGGLERFVADVVATMKQENVLTRGTVRDLILSAHSGGYRPVAWALARGGMGPTISQVFLFDAFYANQDEYRAWLNGGRGVIRAAYTEHLAGEHTSFRTQLPPAAAERFLATPTTVDHDAVVQEFFPRWVHELPDSWKVTPNN